MQSEISVETPGKTRYRKPKTFTEEEEVPVKKTVRQKNSKKKEIKSDKTVNEIEEKENTNEENLIHLRLASKEYSMISDATVEKSKRYIQVMDDFKYGYPSRTDKLCWWCCHSFDSHPIGAPRSFDEDKKQFKVIGCFCSFNCARSFVDKEAPPNVTTNDLLSMYKILTRKIKTSEEKKEKNNISTYENVHQTIHPAPDRYTLKAFGGNLSIEEFRESFRHLKEYNKIYGPLIPWAMYYDEIIGSRRTVMVKGVRKNLEIRKAVEDPEDELSALYDTSKAKKSSEKDYSDKVLNRMKSLGISDALEDLEKEKSKKNSSIENLNMFGDFGISLQKKETIVKKESKPRKSTPKNSKKQLEKDDDTNKSTGKKERKSITELFQMV